MVSRYLLHNRLICKRNSKLVIFSILPRQLSYWRWGLSADILKKILHPNRSGNFIKVWTPFSKVPARLQSEDLLAVLTSALLNCSAWTCCPCQSDPHGHAGSLWLKSEIIPQQSETCMMERSPSVVTRGPFTACWGSCGFRSPLQIHPSGLAREGLENVSPCFPHTDYRSSITMKKWSTFPFIFCASWKLFRRPFTRLCHKEKL